MIIVLSMNTGRDLTWSAHGELDGDEDLVSLAHGLKGAMGTVTGPWVPANWQDPVSATMMMGAVLEALDGPGVAVLGQVEMPQYPGCCDEPEDDKLTKDAVHYRIATIPSETCHTCRFRVDHGEQDSTCQKVQGTVHRTDVCDLYEATGNR